MASVESEYKAVYERLKSDGPSHLDQMDLEPSMEQVFLTRLQTLPHPAVASPRDVREVCLRITQRELSAFDDLVGEEAEELLANLALKDADNEPIGGVEAPEGFRKPRQGQHELIEHQLQTINHHLAYQTSMLQMFGSGQSAMQQQLDITLKGTCPDCTEDLKLTVRRNQTGNDELVLKCRNPKCSGNQPSWDVSDIV